MVQPPAPEASSRLPWLSPLRARRNIRSARRRRHRQRCASRNPGDPRRAEPRVRSTVEGPLTDPALRNEVSRQISRFLFLTWSTCSLSWRLSSRGSVPSTGKIDSSWYRDRRPVGAQAAHFLGGG